MRNYEELYATFHREFNSALELLGAEDQKDNKLLELIAIGPYLANKVGPHRHMVGLIATYLADLKSDFMDLRAGELPDQYLDPALYLETAHAWGFHLLRARNAMLHTIFTNDQFKDREVDGKIGKANLFDAYAAYDHAALHGAHIAALAAETTRSDPTGQLANIMTADAVAATTGWSPV